MASAPVEWIKAPPHFGTLSLDFTSQLFPDDNQQPITDQQLNDLYELVRIVIAQTFIKKALSKTLIKVL
jgi:hypothetical protein